MEFKLGDGEPFLVDGVDVRPGYPFVNGTVADGLLTLQPYAVTMLASGGEQITIAVGGDVGKVRDCVLVLECETAPNITWGDHFSPRTDAETDFACEAGTNVYWITEYAPNAFVVARWQEVSA